MPRELFSRIPKRDFLYMAAAGTFAAIYPWVKDVRDEIVADELRKSAEMAIGGMNRKVIRKDHRQTEIPRLYPEPGWLETSQPARADLLNLNDGGGAYVKYMCTNQPILRHAFSSAVKDFYNYSEPYPNKLGDVFNKHMEYAKKSLDFYKKELNPDLDDKYESTLGDQIHVAVFTMSALFGPYFNRDELNAFGVNLDVTDPGQDNIKWIEERHKHLPTIFPEKREFCETERDYLARCKGGDRSIHFAQHFFLIHQYLYSNMYGLPDKDRIPNWLNSILGLAIIPQLKAIILEEAAGIGWEFIEDYDFDRGIRALDEDGKTPVLTGTRDPLVVNDIAADNLGMLAAQLLNKRNLQQQDIERFVWFLNLPQIYQDGILKLGRIEKIDNTRKVFVYRNINDPHSLPLAA